MNDWVADWDDVLRRAGHSRYRSRGAAAIAAAVAVAVVLLMPGIGIGGGLNALLSGSRPGIPLSAQLMQSGRVIGTLSVRTSRLFVAVDPKSGRVKSFFPARGKPEMRPTFSWSIQLAGVGAVHSLRIVDRSGRPVVRLCSQCRDGARGSFQVDRHGLDTMFRHATVVAATSSGEARGTLGLTASR